MKITFAIIVFLVCFATKGGLAETTDANCVSVNSKITKLENDLKDAKDDFKKYSDINNQIVQNSFQAISNNLSSSTLHLNIFGTIITIVSIAIGIYVSYVLKNVYKIKKHNEELLNSHESIKKHIDSINNNISNNLSALYKHLRDEETKFLLQRLQEVPEDITNICNVLFCRTIPEHEYHNFKSAYIKLKLRDSSNFGLDYYKQQFYQHFSGIVFFDSDIWPDIEDGYDIVLMSAFENDVIKSTDDILSCAIKLEYKEYSVRLLKYLNAISTSKHNNNSKIFDIIVNYFRGDILYLLCSDILNDKSFFSNFRVQLAESISSNYNLLASGTRLNEVVQELKAE